MTRMKAAVAMVLAATVTAAGVEAQDIEIGVRGGLGWTTVSWSPNPLGDGFEELQRRRAPTFGAFVSLAGAGPIRVRGEVLLSPKGFTEVQNNGENTRLSLSYIEVPVLVGYVMPTGTGSVRPEIYAGGWMAWERSCRAGVAAPGVDMEFECDEITDEPILRRTTDWGLAGGAAVSFDIGGPVSGMIDARYSRGLRNVDGEADIANLNVHHRGVSLSGALSIRLGS